MRRREFLKSAAAMDASSGVAAEAGKILLTAELVRRRTA